MEKDQNEIMLSNEDTLSVKFDNYNKVVSNLGFGIGQILMIMIAGLCWFIISAAAMIIGLLPDLLMCDWLLSPGKLSLMFFTARIAIIIGSILFGYIYDKFTKINSIRAGCLIVLCGFIVTRFANSTIVLSAAFAIIGLGMGSLNAADGYIVDFIPSEKYGLGILLEHMFFPMGSIFSSIFAYFYLSQQDWQTWVSILFSPVILLFILSIIAPESPLSHFRRGNMQKGNQILKNIAKANKKEVDLNLQPAINEIKNNENSIQSKISFISMIIAFIVVFFNGCMTFSLFFEINKVQHGCSQDESHANSTSNFTENNVKCIVLSKHDFILHITSSFTEIVSLILLIVILKYLKPKIILIISFGLFGISNFMFLLCLNNAKNIVVIFAAKLLLFINSSVVWVYLGLYFPKKIRGKLLGVANVMFNLGAIAAPFSIQFLFFIDRSYMIYCTSTVALSGAIMSVFLKNV